MRPPCSGTQRGNAGATAGLTCRADAEALLTKKCCNSVQLPAGWQPHKSVQGGGGLQGLRQHKNVPISRL